MPSVAPPPAGWDIEADVVIIGGGACGLVAGLRALEAGADVVVVEREPRLGGSTAMSSGFVPAPETRWQRAIGVEDDPATFAADIQHKAAGGAHAGIVDTVTRAIGPALEWLADAHGLEWHVLDDFLYPGHSRHRMHAAPEMTGAGLMARLETAAERAGLTVVTGARARVLSMDGDRAVAVGIERRDGRREIVRTGAVILACNGYGGNRALVAEHIPEIAAAPYHGHPGNTGDAVLWGRALGAAERDLSAYQGHGALAHPHGILITWALMMEGGIQVNSAGRRFSNEHQGYSEQAVRVLAEPGGIAWTIFDERLHDLGMTFPDYRAAHAAGAVRRGDLPALAAATGLPVAALRETLAQVRGLADGGADPFGRDFTGQPPLGGALRAIRVTGALFHTQGGLVVDGTARVMRRDGRVFANLFAGGGAACGVSGARVEGYLSGNGLLSAIALGYVAGREAGNSAAGL